VSLSPCAPFDLYLASHSPRRRELLAQLNIRYQLLSVSVDERPRPGESVTALVVRLAAEKAQAGAAQIATTLSSIPVLGADTLVVVDGEPLGKPANRAAALAMLARLSGREHQVLSGIAIVLDGVCHTRLVSSRVTFCTISDDEAAAYWRSGEPSDKAGGYAIQGRGARFVQQIVGSYSGVMGLPLYETAELLQQLGVVWPWDETISPQNEAV